MVGDWNESCYSSQCKLNVLLDTSWSISGYTYYDHNMDRVYCSGSEERLGDCDFILVSGYSYTAVRVTCQQSEHNYSRVHDILKVIIACNVFMLIPVLPVM